MKCTENDRETCREEKRGCEGCYYNEFDPVDELIKEIKTDSVDSFIYGKYIKKIEKKRGRK